MEDHQYSKNIIVVQGQTQNPTKTLDNSQRSQVLDSGAPSVNSRGRGKGLPPPKAGSSRSGKIAVVGSERAAAAA